MIDFSKYRRIKIPEGMVKTIKRKSDGLILWVAKYLNIISKATTTTGGTEIYNGIGYKEGDRWSSSGGTVVEGNKDHRVSGWMMHEAGKTYRVKYFGLGVSGYVSGVYIVFANANGSIIHTIATGEASSEQYTTTYRVDLTQDLLTFVNTDTSAEYFRISGYCAKSSSNADLANKFDAPIITCDEEITD